MFKCKTCIEKQKFIDFLIEKNKDLHDRLMAFNKDAFTYYQAETKQGEPLFPHGMDKDGERLDYKDTDPKIANDEIYRAFGEDPITVEDKQGM